MSASIFISYASQDAKVANTLCKALESRGFPCWIASRDIAPGENFQIAIVRAIRSAKIMLLVFTGNSNNSDEMAKELALASQSKLIVVPLRIEDVRQNDAFAYEFATRQWIDFFADWETAIEQLANRIAVALGVEATPVHAATTHPPPPPAPPPVDHGAPGPTPQVVAAAFAAPGVVAAASQPASAPPASQAAPAAAPPPLAATDVGPSSFAPAMAKRSGAPVALFVALGLLAVVLIGGAVVVLPSFLAKKPLPPAATNAAVNALPPVATYTAPPAAVPVDAQAATPGPPIPPPPLAGSPETPVQPSARGPSAAPQEDTDADPDAQRQDRPHRHGGGEGRSDGGGPVEVPF